MKIPTALFDLLLPLGLPPEWKVVRAEIKFERKGVLGEWASVIWDDANETFYVKTNKAIVYPDDVKALNEAVGIMDKANKKVRRHIRRTRNVEPADPEPADDPDDEDEDPNAEHERNYNRDIAQSLKRHGRD